MTGKDFGLTGVTDKLKRSKVTQDKDKSEAVSTNEVEPDKSKSVTVEPVTALPEQDFRQEALARLNKPSAPMIHQAIATARKKPRIGVYSPLVSAAAEYLRDTVPKYSASDEARKILEDEFERRYPELVKQIKSEMG